MAYKVRMAQRSLKQVRKLNQRVAARAQGLAHWMYEAGVLAANTERDTHRYTNRTGFLELTTGAEIVASTPNFSMILVQMQQDYATYIVDDYAGQRGKLSYFRDHMDELESFFNEELPTHLHTVVPAAL